MQKTEDRRPIRNRRAKLVRIIRNRIQRVAVIERDGVFWACSFAPDCDLIPEHALASFRADRHLWRGWDDTGEGRFLNRISP